MTFGCLLGVFGCLLGIHSQSNRTVDQPLCFENNSAEQAFAGRVVCLENMIAYGVPVHIEPWYKYYLKQYLNISLPPEVVPGISGVNLSRSISSDPEAIKKIAAIAGSRSLALSTFDYTPSEDHLLQALQKAGVNIIPELNPVVSAQLGSKAGFRTWCQQEGLPQVPGGIFNTMEGDSGLLKFTVNALKKGQGIIFKDPFGTAGVGLEILCGEEALTSQLITKWQSVMKNGAVVAEYFSPNGGEHVIQVYIDPFTKEATILGPYDQIVTREENGLAFYGSSYPMADTQVAEKLVNLVKTKIIPALLKAGYTGPAGFDVLSNPLPGYEFHLMELNARWDAIAYAKKMVDQVLSRTYPHMDPNTVNFLLFTGLSHQSRSFQEFIGNNQSLLMPKERGTVIFTNPLRHACGQFDVIALSFDDHAAARNIMFQALETMWDKPHADDFFGRIYLRGGLSTAGSSRRL